MSGAALSGVTYEEDGDVAVLTIDNPPVNALSSHVRAGLLEGIRRAEASPAARAIVLICAGRTFVAGADIREFGKPPAPPTIPEVFAAIENAGKPTVAAIHGSALGGGFELAMVCSARVALQTARFGLPEIRLGVIPGAGGTQRLPRLAGLARALDMILSGEPVPASPTLADVLVPEGGDLREAAIAHARALIAAIETPPRLRDRAPDLAPQDAATLIAARRAALIAADPQEAAGLAALAVIEIGLLCDFDTGLAVERAAFAALRDSPRAAQKREAFFAARRKPA